MSTCSLRRRVAWAAISSLGVACGASDDNNGNGSTADWGTSSGGGLNAATTGGSGASVGGSVGMGGSAASGFGGTSAGGQWATGGSVASGGQLATGGTIASGGQPATGGQATGGQATGGQATGGQATGGWPATGGQATGGWTATGGQATGGWTATGGQATGGWFATGGQATGGQETGGTATGGQATGGTEATGGSATCDPTWDPPDSANGNTNLVSGLEEIWARSGDVIMGASNIKIHQIMENGGSLRYCARWDSDQPLNATERGQIEALIASCDNHWTQYLTGWGCWPFGTISVDITVWAVRDLSLLTGWSDSEGVAVASSDASCPSGCGPLEPGQSASNCSAAPFDEFFWLDGSLTDYTGWGSATGFYMGASAFLSAATSGASAETIVVHEMGHAHGLDDFYDWQPTGWTSWVMWAGAAMDVTETDGWMLRDVWRHVRSDYGYPGP